MEKKYEIFNTPMHLGEPSNILRAFEKTFDSEFFDLFNPRVFPHYNIVQVQLADDSNPLSIHRIDIALSGYSRNDLSITTDDKYLYIEGKGQSEDDSEGGETILHKGISTKKFELKFKLSRNTKAVSAEMDNGILSVVLETHEYINSKTTIEIEEKQPTQQQLLQE